MASLTLPSFVTLKRKYPTSSDPDKVKQEIGGEAVEELDHQHLRDPDVGGFQLLRRGPVQDPEIACAVDHRGRRQAALRHPRVQEFVDFLRDNYGPPGRDPHR